MNVVLFHQDLEQGFSIGQCIVGFKVFSREISMENLSQRFMQNWQRIAKTTDNFGEILEEIVASQIVEEHWMISGSVREQNDILGPMLGFLLFDPIYE